MPARRVSKNTQGTDVRHRFDLGHNTRGIRVNPSRNTMDSRGWFSEWFCKTAVSEAREASQAPLSRTRSRGTREANSEEVHRLFP
jgi:hypothetical protein